MKRRSIWAIWMGAAGLIVAPAWAQYYEDYPAQPRPEERGAWVQGRHYNAESGRWEYGWYYDTHSAGTTHVPSYDPGRTARPYDDYDRGARSHDWVYNERTRSWEYIGPGQMHGGQGFEQHVTGEIVELYQQHLNGEPNVFAVLRTYPGGMVRAHLGPMHRVFRLNLDEGDQISLVGHFDNVSSRRVLVADQIMANGEFVALNRPPYPQPGYSESHWQPQPVSIDGEIESLHVRSIDGREHLWARLETDGGRTLTVDLGPRSNFFNVELDEGDDITVFGEKQQLGGESAFRALQVRTEDDGTIFVARGYGPGWR